MTTETRPSFPAANINSLKNYTPGAYDRDFRALTIDVFGRRVDLLFQAVQSDPQERIERLSYQLDMDALGRIQEGYNLSSSVSAEEFYLKQQKHANGVIDLITRTALPGASQRYSLLSEVETVSDRPSNVIHLLALTGSMEPEYRDMLRFELQRRQLFAVISAGIHMRSSESRINTILASIKLDMLKGFYQNPGPDPNIVHSAHDNETNNTLYVGFEPGPREAGIHTKRQEFYLRKVPGVGKVMVKERKKDDAAAILKAIAKAKSQDGWVHTDSDIEDMIGMHFIVLEAEDNQARTRALEVKLVEFLQTLQLDTALTGCEPKITKEIFGKNNRNKSSEFRGTKLKVSFEGDTDREVQIEFMIQNAIDGFNGLLKVGSRKPTGLYSGPAHPSWEVQRIIDILDIIYPPSIYGGGPKIAAVETLDSVVANLRQFARI